MGLEQLKQEILNNAKAKASAIIKDAESEAKEIVNNAKTQIDEYKKLQEVEMKKELGAEERLYIAFANSGAKEIILIKKKEIIDSVFISAKEEIYKQYKSKGYIVRLIKRSEKEIDIGMIYCNKEDLNDIKSYKVEAKDINGIIAENKEGTIRVDLSFDTILEDVRSKYLTEIAGILFKD